MDISNMSISDSHQTLPNQSIVEPEQPREEPMQQEQQQQDTAEQLLQAQLLQQQQLTKDLFNLYSLSFLCKSKDLSERRIRLDFGIVAEVSRIRGQLGRAEAPVIVSFETREDCVKCLQDKALATKYPTLAPAPSARIVADRDGYYSIEFTNAGMSGVREITNEFSRHGEIVKVQQGGARNAVKRMTVSYQDVDAAMRALQHYAHSNDVRGIDFVSECMEFDVTE